MAIYWRQGLDELGHHVEPTLETLNPLQLMRRGPVEAVMRAQDYVAAISRRVVCGGGLGGSETWRTPNTDPTVSSGTHPAPSGRRRIAAGSMELTPGCFLRAWAAVVPSGQTQITGTTAGGAQGRLEVDVTWTDTAGSVTTTHGVQLRASTEAFAAEPGVAWNEIDGHVIIEITPTALLDTSVLRRWSQHVHVDVEIFAVAGARILDSCVFEFPISVAFEADDDGEAWTSHLLAPGSPAGPGLPLTYPFQRFSETTPDGDPRGGTLHLLDVHHAQHRRLGPVLFSWSAHEESSGAENVEVASSTWVALEGGGSTGFDSTEPGCPASTGGYARRHASNSTYVLRDRVAAIPVITRVLAVSSTGIAEVRVQTQPWSFIDVALTNGSERWHSVAGWLEVGITPDQQRVAQLFGQNSLAASFSIAAVEVYYAGGYTPPA